MSIKLAKVLGFSGVDPRESRAAVLWGRRLEWPILLVALWIPIEWYLEEINAIGMGSVKLFDWIIWSVFVFETSFMTFLVKDKWRYLSSNWMNLVIIVAGTPLEWVHSPLIGALRNLRLLLMAYLLIKLSRRLKQLLGQGRVGSILLICLVVVALSGIVVTRLDPSIGSIWDGMWWAWVTVSHTGYGDIVPVTEAGRMFGALLIFLGIVLVSLMTASLSAFLIGSEVEKLEDEEKATEKLLKDLVVRLERIEQKLDATEARKL
ncbi:MAG: potassium channel family protein [Methylophilaceae bacterium]